MSGDAEFWARQPRVSYFWLEQQLDTDDTFAREALDVLRYVAHDSTLSTASSAIGLLNRWTVQRELTVYDRGNPVADVTDVTLMPDGNGNYERAMNSVERDWRIDRAEFVALLTRYRMTVPNFVKLDAPEIDNVKANMTVWTDEKKEQLRKEHASLRANGYKSPTKTLAEKYGVSRARIRALKGEDPVSKSNTWTGLGGK